MEDYSKQHKKAWEFNAYDFWVRTAGTPEERALKDKENPKKMLKQYANYFDFLRVSRWLTYADHAARKQYWHMGEGI